MLDELQRFQTAIVGILGFSGVILTLWWSARLARVARVAIREQQSASVKVAMLEEFRCIESDLVQKLWLLKDIERGGTLNCARTPVPTIFNMLVKDIGLLQPEQVRAAIIAHSSLENTDWSLRANFHVADNGLIEIGVKHEIARMFYDSALEKVMEAIKLFESPGGRR